MLTVALTGGIATGKSHVLRQLAAMGLPTIEADQVAVSLVRQGTPGWAAVVRRFGEDILAPDREIDRKRLAGIVFDDDGARADLEAIVHPEIFGTILEWFEGLASQGTHRAAIADIPLLYETGHEGDVDRVVVTACPPDTQLSRVMQRDGLTADEARRRMAAQWPTARKVERADRVIVTDGTFEDTARQVDTLVRDWHLLDPR